MNTTPEDITADAPETRNTGGVGDASPRRPRVSGSALSRAKRRDRIARWVISLGGAAVILSVLAILLAIVSVTLPLFRPAQCREVARCSLPAGIEASDVLAVGVESALGVKSQAAYLLLSSGAFVFLDPTTGEVVRREIMDTSGAESASKAPRKVVHAERHDAARYSLLWSDGSLSLIGVDVAASARDGHDRPTIAVLKFLPPQEGSPPTKALLRRSDEDAVTAARLWANGRLEIAGEQTTENLLGEKEAKTRHAALDTGGLGPITTMAMDRAGRSLYVGTSTGQLARWQFDKDGQITATEALTAFPDKRAVTALALVLGDVSLAVGDAKGEVTIWAPVRYEGKARLTQLQTLARHDGPIQDLLPSSRTRSMLSVSAEGTIQLDHITSQRNLVSLASGAPLRGIGLAPRGDAFVTLGAMDDFVLRHVDAPHPEVSWSSLFGSVWYESYDQPAHVWQTTGGDDFEGKFSLVPLLSGTLKGTFYAMVFAVPLALFGAAYTSHFTTPRLKRIIKPTVEVMAAVPSVVLGLLAALWLAPLLERWILALCLAFATVPAVFIAFLAAWQWLRRFEAAKRLENGYEFLLLAPVLLAGVGAAALAAPAAELLWFDGHFRLWLYQTLDLRYDQRNCVVIAFGLGFTVIPIILSLAEDSLSGVPRTLTAASMALGASRWQTMWRVILPSASPGIFAGIMIGLGRAVGETMIVLMATGNTPITSWSPLNGMRTLSANIAVEVSEAPVGGTLYRVLFLCAVLLFLLTFTLNTAAEIVRQRLRQRYGRFS